MLIQLHILQNYAPSNLNRDDTGAPKDAMFGGVRRGRISSQCLKRSMRRSPFFSEEFRADGLLAVRTKLLPAAVETALSTMGASDAERRAIVARVPEIGKKGETKGDEEAPAGDGDVAEEEALSAGQTRQLIFFTDREAEGIAAKLLDKYRQLGNKGFAKEKIDELERSLNGGLPRSVDIAMFGRMTTSAAFQNVEAAVQVAHALSTNAVAQEFDYYTAVDDISGQSGAGMIGDVEFNSSTYYKYLNVHWEELVRNLGGDTAVARRAVPALLHAAALAHPSGKQNSFAAFNPPDFILVEVSATNLPMSYANAFVRPAAPWGGLSVVERSIEMLYSYIAKVDRVYGGKSKRATVSLSELAAPNGLEVANLESLVALKGWLATRLPE